MHNVRCMMDDVFIRYSIISFLYLRTPMTPVPSLLQSRFIHLLFYATLLQKTPLLRFYESGNQKIKLV